ncbi:MAG: glycerol kinase [Elusimicrobia bacterium]|nr:glycerol kinase [Elusimicrobiota bacterium]
MKEAIIALDQGSSSSRALVIGPGGKVGARAQHPIKTYNPQPGWFEHDAEEIWRTIDRSLDEALAALPKSTRVLCAGLTTQRSTFVLWDSKTGKSLCRAPSWQDGRAGEVVESVRDRQLEIHERTGLYLTPYYSAPKLRWLIDRHPAVKKALDAGRLRAGPVGTYLLYRLTRGEVFAADPSLAQRMMLFNIRSLDWDERALETFGVPREILPSIRASADHYGEIERRGRKIPVTALLGDQQAASLGLGGEEAGSGVLNYGTGAFFLLNTGQEQHRIPGLLTSVAWQRHGQRCQYFQEGTVHAAGSSFQWLQDSLGVLSGLGKIDATCRRSKQRILALNAVGGLGAPRWDYTTFTTFLGMNSRTCPEDFVRAVAEGVAFLISDIVFAARRAGLSVKSTRASGGLSRVDYLMQFQADILQSDIIQVKEAEATALGIASLAAEEAGAHWAAGLRADGGGKTFSPKMPAEQSAKLSEGWRLFVESQQKLSAELRRLGVLP